MQYRWNETLPKGTTAEELSLYDPRRPHSGAEALAGVIVFLALWFLAKRFLPGVLAVREVREFGSWGDFITLCAVFCCIFVVPFFAGTWINHRIFKMDYREDVKGKRVYATWRVNQYVLFLIVALAVVYVVGQRLMVH